MRLSLCNIDGLTAVIMNAATLRPDSNDSNECIGAASYLESWFSSKVLIQLLGALILISSTCTVSLYTSSLLPPGELPAPQQVGGCWDHPQELPALPTLAPSTVAAHLWMQDVRRSWDACRRMMAYSHNRHACINYDRSYSPTLYHECIYHLWAARWRRKTVPRTHLFKGLVDNKNNI